MPQDTASWPRAPTEPITLNALLTSGWNAEAPVITMLTAFDCRECWGAHATLHRPSKAMAKAGEVQFAVLPISTEGTADIAQLAVCGPRNAALPMGDFLLAHCVLQTSLRETPRPCATGGAQLQRPT